MSNDSKPSEQAASLPRLVRLEGCGAGTFKCVYCGNPIKSRYAEMCRRCWPTHHARSMRNIQRVASQPNEVQPFGHIKWLCEYHLRQSDNDFAKAETRKVLEWLEQREELQPNE